MIFNRREALKGLAFLPMMKGAKAVQLGDPKAKHFILFFDRQVLDAQALTENSYEGLLPKNASIILIGLHLRRDQSIEEAVQLYEVPDGV